MIRFALVKSRGTGRTVMDIEALIDGTRLCLWWDCTDPCTTKIHDPTTLEHYRLQGTATQCAHLNRQYHPCLCRFMMQTSQETIFQRGNGHTAPSCCSSTGSLYLGDVAEMDQHIVQATRIWVQSQSDDRHIVTSYKRKAHNQMALGFQIAYSRLNLQVQMMRIITTSHYCLWDMNGVPFTWQNTWLQKCHVSPTYKRLVFCKRGLPWNGLQGHWCSFVIPVLSCWKGTFCSTKSIDLQISHEMLWNQKRPGVIDSWTVPSRWMWPNFCWSAVWFVPVLDWL
jgi:hypothetical protein